MITTAIGKSVDAEAPLDHEEPVVLAAPRAGVGAVAACILLGGGLRPSPLARLCPCSVLDLMVRPGVSVLQAWCTALSGLGRDALLPVTVALDAQGQAPALDSVDGSVHLAIDRDLSPYRGPAGAVRDRYALLDADAIVLVGETARYVSADLWELVASHVAEGHDVTVGCNGNGDPAGIYVVRKRTLDNIPAIGFMDLKEQWLAAAVGGGRRVFVHTFKSGAIHPLRTREQFLDAVLAPRCDEKGSSLVSGTANVVDGAFVRRSVVMRSAYVASGAVVVRSLVLPGARVEAGGVVVDGVVGAAVSHDSCEGPIARWTTQPFPLRGWRRATGVEFG